MNTHNSCTDFVDVDVGEDFIDPRVQIELEQLNSATDAINKLEVELDEARASFRQLLSDSSQKINHLSKKLGNCIDKARPYYEARMKAKEAHTETQKAALKFERANSAHAAAKEMVFLAEEGLQKEGRTFDPAWQEMLNHATMRVNEAERERTFSEVEHRTTSHSYNEAEQRVQQLQKDLKRAISKSRPYFEMKAQFNQMMEEQKKEVHKLEVQILYVKQSYAVALHNLEEISDEIHQRRQQKQECSSLGSRGPGVGAESPIPPPQDRGTSTNDINMSLNTEDFYLRLPKRLGPLKNSSTSTSDTIAAYVEEMSPTNVNMVGTRNQYRVDQSSQTEASTAQSKIALKDTPSAINADDESLESDRVSAWVHESGLRALASARRANLMATVQQSHGRLVGHGLPARFMAEESDMSDAESLTSTDVLTDEQIVNLMLDKDLEEAYQDIVVVPKRPKELPGTEEILNELRQSFGKSEHKSDAFPSVKVDHKLVDAVSSVDQITETQNVLANDAPALTDIVNVSEDVEALDISSCTLTESEVLTKDAAYVKFGEDDHTHDLDQKPEAMMKQGGLEESKPQGEREESELQGGMEGAKSHGELEESKPQGRLEESKPQGRLEESKPISDSGVTRSVQNTGPSTQAVNPVQEIKVVAVQFTVTETVVTPKMSRAVDKRSCLPLTSSEKSLNKNVMATENRFKDNAL